MTNTPLNCSDIDVAKEIWTKLVSNQNEKKQISSKLLVHSLPNFIKILNKKELSDTFKTRHIHKNINFEQFLCLLAALGDDPTFKAQVAFQQLSSDGEKPLTRIILQR